MFAQCPTCRTVYQVSAADLNVSRGRIHCDFCETTFDALGSLTEHPVAPAAGPSDCAALEAPDDPALPDDPEPADDLDDVVAGDAETQPPDLSAESLATAAAAGEEVAGEVPSALVAAASEIATEQVASGAIAPVEAMESQITPEVATSELEVRESLIEPHALEAHAASAQAGVDAAPPGVAPQGQPEVESKPAPELEPEALDPDTLRGLRRSPGSRAWWSFVALLMLLLLGAQLVHRSRSELIMQPAIAPWMSRIYSALGVRLDPKWEIDRYRIVPRAQMSAVAAADGATRLRLVATVANDAARPQPYPLVRLTLEDRWGSAVGTRDFAPREYLHDAARAASLLAPGEQAEIDVLVVDPGMDAAGFRLDMCLADADGVIRCADES